MPDFGFDLETEMEGWRFSIGHQRMNNGMPLAMTRGYPVFLCSNMAFAGDFAPKSGRIVVDCVSAKAKLKHVPLWDFVWYRTAGAPN